MESSTTTEIWSERVSAWRASGERAETFSRRGGYAASTLRWWSSKLKRDMTAPAVDARSTVQLARVIRAPKVASAEPGGHAIVLEVEGTAVRIVIQPGADAATLAMILEVVRGGRS